MPEIIHGMQNALEMAGGNVGFTALFLTGLFALWNGKFKNNITIGHLFWYALAVLIFIISPFYQSFVQKSLPELTTDNMSLWILPTAPVILYVAVTAVDYGKNIMSRLFLVGGMIALLVLAAMTSYSQSERQVAENEFCIPQKEYEVIVQVDNYRQEMHLDTVLLWGEASVMEYARIYSGNIYTLYGKDLWLGPVDSQLHQIYEDVYYEAYEWMENPANNLPEIGEMARCSECDILVISRDTFPGGDGDVADVLGDVYYLYYISEDYLIYAR